MPDSPRFDDGRDGLEGANPTRDLWAEAEARAAEPSITPLTVVPDTRRRHPARWVAVAAAIAVIAGVSAAILTSDDDGDVLVGPSATATTAPAGTEVIGEPCSFLVTGDPISFTDGYAPGSPFEGSAEGLSWTPTVVHAELGGTPAEISVPGQVLTDLVGEEVEDVTIGRGTAQLWFSDGFVQARWFTGGQDECESFTVTAFDEDRDTARHVAVDLAERIQLQSEVALTEPVSVEALTGTWQLERLTVDGDPTAGRGLTLQLGTPFSSDPTGSNLDWGDGCAGGSGSYHVVADETDLLRIGEIARSDEGCADNPTEAAFNAMMTGLVHARCTGDSELTLSADGMVATFRRTDPGPDTGAGDGRTVELTYPTSAPHAPLWTPPASTGSPEQVAERFGQEVLGWNDARVQDGGAVDAGDGTTIVGLESPAAGGSVHVWVSADDDAVIRVDSFVDPDDPQSSVLSSTELEIAGRTARVWVGALAWPLVTEVSLDAGDGAMGSSHPAGQRAMPSWELASDPGPGSLLIRYVDDQGRVVHAAGLGLAGGDVQWSGP